MESSKQRIYFIYDYFGIRIKLKDLVKSLEGASHFALALHG